MAKPGGDPYATLGVKPGVSDAELRAAYRRLVQLHHPDHNGGSEESERRFEEIQDAYAKVRQLRTAAHGPGQAPPGAGARSPRAGRTPPRDTQAPPPPADDPGIAARLADLERQVREARDARERARQAAREAARATTTDDARKRPSDEELGYYSTDDSFSSILADARTQLGTLFSEAKETKVTEKVADLLDDLADKLKAD
jgi:curved DNA-binding protein CbpA